MKVHIYIYLRTPWCREANWFAASQEIPRISQNAKVRYRSHKHPQRYIYIYIEREREYFVALLNKCGISIFFVLAYYECGCFSAAMPVSTAAGTVVRIQSNTEVDPAYVRCFNVFTLFFFCTVFTYIYIYIYIYIYMSFIFSFLVGTDICIRKETFSLPPIVDFF